MTNQLPEFYTAKITLQLRDSVTGKVIHESYGENFAANQTIRYAKWLQRQQYKNGIAGIGSPDTDYQPHDATNSLVLTDSTLTPDPVNEWTMPGKLIGYSAKSTYAGADPWRGTPNVGQLDAQPGFSKWVFDWPTSAGNGTINSVGWVRDITFSSSTTGSGPLFMTACTNEQQWTTPQNWTYIARANTNLSFGSIANTVIYVLNNTFQQDTTFNVNGQFTAVRGIAWDSGNNFLWVIGDNGAARRIAAYNSSGVLQTGPYTLTTRDYISLTHDGTKLWSMTNNSNEQHTAWSISTSDGSDVTNFNFNTYRNPGPDSYAGWNIARGICWEPTNQRLWIRTRNTNSGEANYAWCGLYCFDTSGNKQAVDVSLAAWTPTSAGYNTRLWNYNINNDIDVIDSSQFLMSYSTNMYRVRLTGLGTRSKLDSPVVKTNTQTLKVIYQINYV